MINVLFIIALAITFIIVLDWLIALISHDTYSTAMKHRADKLSRNKK